MTEPFSFTFDDGDAATTDPQETIGGSGSVTVPVIDTTGLQHRGEHS